ncbi:MAG: alkaline phosphatase family protein [Bacteroidales bacterium]|nr:alkaline phosphatase family protein [Bacteroidales bacterium]
MKTLFVPLIILFMIVNSSFYSQAQDADRVILFMIDGLNWEAPYKADMPNFNSLIKEGTYIQKSYMILPYHPTIGDYSTHNSCSFPNPILHSGTIFIKPDNKMIQEQLSPEHQTAFIVNTTAYRSVARGFTTCIMDPGLTDNQVVEQSVKLLQDQDPVFMRIHLQTPGELGRSVSVCEQDKPYYRNIFGEGSPYVESIENADQLLGKLISFLKESGKWDHTVLIVTSDHGQSKIGWHAMFDEDAWVTPMVFAGKGIAKGRLLPYFEHTDLAPTVAWLLGHPVNNNNGGAGNPVNEISEKTDLKDFSHPMYIKKINEQIKTFNFYKSALILKSEENSYYSLVLSALENENLTPEPFYHQDRITDWYKAGSTSHMIEANEKILHQMKKELDK